MAKLTKLTGSVSHLQRRRNLKQRIWRQAVRKAKPKGK